MKLWVSFFSIAQLPAGLVCKYFNRSPFFSGDKDVVRPFVRSSLSSVFEEAAEQKTAEKKEKKVRARETKSEKVAERLASNVCSCPFAFAFRGLMIFAFPHFHVSG